MPGLVAIVAFAAGYDAFAQLKGWESICSAARRIGRRELREGMRDFTGFRRALVSGVLFGLVVHVALDGDW